MAGAFYAQVGQRVLLSAAEPGDMLWPAGRHAPKGHGGVVQTVQREVVKQARFDYPVAMHDPGRAGARRRVAVTKTRPFRACHPARAPLAVSASIGQRCPRLQGAIPTRSHRARVEPCDGFDPIPRVEGDVDAMAVALPPFPGRERERGADGLVRRPWSGAVVARWPTENGLDLTPRRAGLDPAGEVRADPLCGRHQQIADYSPGRQRETQTDRYPATPLAGRHHRVPRILRDGSVIFIFPTCSRRSQVVAIAPANRILPRVRSSSRVSVPEGVSTLRPNTPTLFLLID